MSFDVKFDTKIAESPAPSPPFIGSGIFGFNGSSGQPNLPDGSYKFADLNNVEIDFAFDIPQITSYALYFYYTGPADSNISFDYKAADLYVDITSNGSQFYFNGPAATCLPPVKPGDPEQCSGSLNLVMDPAYVANYYPELDATKPVFLSFEPNNVPVPPSTSPPTAPFNRYGIYANLNDPSPDGTDIIVNGIYGTVPGPLPLAGASTAFLLSRRLRQRQRLVRSQSSH